MQSNCVELKKNKIAVAKYNGILSANENGVSKLTSNTAATKIIYFLRLKVQRKIQNRLPFAAQNRQFL